MSEDRAKQAMESGTDEQMRRWIGRSASLCNYASKEGVELLVVVRIWDPIKREEKLNFVYPSSPINARGILASALDVASMISYNQSFRAGAVASQEDEDD